MVEIGREEDSTRGAEEKENGQTSARIRGGYDVSNMSAIVFESEQTLQTHPRNGPRRFETAIAWWHCIKRGTQITMTLSISVTHDGQHRGYMVL